MPARLAVRRAALAVLLVLAFAAPQSARAQGEVFKCVDRGGHVTYQQSPCAGGAKGGQVELVDPVVVGKPAAPAAPVEQGWPAMAREKRIAVGMPKTFVTEAYGAPIEIRSPRSGETGSEVWVYSRAGQVTRIGFQNNLVAWTRSDSALPDSKPGAALTPAPPPSREARVRNALVVGKACNTALAEAGPPDREEPLAGPAGGGTRYVFAFDAANANAYAAAVCIGGRITSVERYVPNVN